MNIKFKQVFPLFILGFVGMVRGTSWHTGCLAIPDPGFPRWREPGNELGCTAENLLTTVLRRPLRTLFMAVVSFSPITLLGVR